MHIPPLAETSGLLSKLKLVGANDIEVVYDQANIFRLVDTLDIWNRH